MRCLAEWFGHYTAGSWIKRSIGESALLVLVHRARAEDHRVAAEHEELIAKKHESRLERLRALTQESHQQ